MLEFITRAEAERMIREALDALAQEQMDDSSRQALDKFTERLTESLSDGFRKSVQGIVVEFLLDPESDLSHALAVALQRYHDQADITRQTDHRYPCCQATPRSPHKRLLSRKTIMRVRSASDEDGLQSSAPSSSQESFEEFVTRCEIAADHFLRWLRRRSGETRR